MDYLLKLKDGVTFDLTYCGSSMNFSSFPYVSQYHVWFHSWKKDKDILFQYQETHGEWFQEGMSYVSDIENHTWLRANKFRHVGKSVFGQIFYPKAKLAVAYAAHEIYGFTTGFYGYSEVKEPKFRQAYEFMKSNVQGFGFALEMGFELANFAKSKLYTEVYIDPKPDNWAINSDNDLVWFDPFYYDDEFDIYGNEE